jgi:CubicO group peptidase (beta-lactamase class C family)
VADGWLIDGWPEGSAAEVIRVEGGRARTLFAAGDDGVTREWASVSKLAVALAVGVELEWGLHRLDEPMGPTGSTLANLLSHSSGLGLEEGDPRRPVGERRVYSNAGIDLAVSTLVEGGDPARWLAERVFEPLGMEATRLEGRPAAGVVGPTRDLTRLALAWLRPDGVSREMRDRLIRPYAPQLAGVVPGFGRFDPCPWGLGPEVRGTKRHWMGEWPPESFGHFGQSGALLLANAAEQLAVVATSVAPFGPWAAELWPRWTTLVLERARAA